MIHQTAIVSPDARLGENVEIGPYSMIGSKVEIGDGTVVENHVTIRGRTVIGKENSIGAYASIGFAAQDKNNRNQDTRVVIGDGNEIREYVSINRGTLSGKGVTTIGNHNQIMISCHFGHDAVLGDYCMLANSTTLAGHVEIGSYVVTGGMSGFHQFCRVGSYAMIGGACGVYQDVAPYMMCVGHRGIIMGLNKVGLRRNGFSAEEIVRIKKIYRIFFDRKLTVEKAMEALRRELPYDSVLDRFLYFAQSSKRGLIRKTGRRSM